MAVASSRICQLAQPRRRQVHEVSSHKANPVPMVHLPYKASAHIELLASKSLHHVSEPDVLYHLQID